MNATATLALLLSRFTFELPPELRGPGALWDLQARHCRQQRQRLPVAVPPAMCNVTAACSTLIGFCCAGPVQCNLMTNQPRDGLPMRCIPRPT